MLKGIWREGKGEMGMNMIACLCNYDILENKENNLREKTVQKHG